MAKARKKIFYKSEHIHINTTTKTTHINSNTQQSKERNIVGKNGRRRRDICIWYKENKRRSNSNDYVGGGRRQRRCRRRRRTAAVTEIGKDFGGCEFTQWNNFVGARVMSLALLSGMYLCVCLMRVIWGV